MGTKNYFYINKILVINKNNLNVNYFK